MSAPTTIDWKYSFQNGYSFTITTFDTPDASGIYSIDGVSGTYNLINPLNLTLSTPGIFYGDQLISSSSGFYHGVDDYGVTVSDGTTYYNIFSDSQTGPTILTYALVSDVNSETLSALTSFSTDPACFTPNTLISTPTGSTPVQDLQIGDLILNHAGESVPVKWIGRQRLHPAFAGDHLPICIKQGALGHDLPTRDLFVSPGHAFYIDDCLLIDAKALINGTTITQVTQWEGDIEYFHIETQNHEIILAEGAPAETFMDNVSRACFNNYSEYQALYPDAPEMIELDIPRVSHQRQLPNAVKRHLEQIAQELVGDGDTGKVLRVG